MILIIDNFDSFVYNLARHFERLGQETLVVRNGAIDATGVAALQPSAVVLSPGPCAPDQAGNSLRIVRAVVSSTPVLGVCLGHQIVAAACGAAIVRAPIPVHGRTTNVLHRGDGLFAGVGNPLTACRYHSLVVDEQSLPAELEVTARTKDGTIMAIAHATRPVFGVQFHPEAILTVDGYLLLANFLRLAGLPCDCDARELAETELATTKVAAAPLPATPVTF